MMKSPTRHPEPAPKLYSTCLFVDLYPRSRRPLSGELPLPASLPNHFPQTHAVAVASVTEERVGRTWGIVWIPSPMF